MRSQDVRLLDSGGPHAEAGHISINDAGFRELRSDSDYCDNATEIWKSEVHEREQVGIYLIRQSGAHATLWV
jgi:hypothetical protein